jgi:hypothetical protein
MSIQTERVKYPASEREEQVGLICDLCGAHSPDKDGWGSDQHDVDDVTISREVGTSYPGDYMTTTTCFDLCRDCWTNKLVPWFASQGATPRESET